ncbi:MAG: hypothetical protein K2J74_01340, partial [Muribaculaceae bacterium]|nr:hypothetical protein [Muribaculaceae bacterium]
MKKQDFDNNIDKHSLPYRESEEYVSALIERCASHAIAQAQSNDKSDKRHFGLWRNINYRIASVAAAIAIVASVGLGLLLKQSPASGTDNSLYASQENNTAFDAM